MVLLIVLVRRRPRLAWSPVLLGVAVLFAGFCVSLVGAADPAGSQALLAGRGRDLFYFVVVYALLLTTGAIARVAQAVVLVLGGAGRADRGARVRPATTAATSSG